MTLDGRDRVLVQYVARFKQLTSAHILELVFADRASRTPCDRALNRLVANDYLARIERRLVGGARGGAGQYVYQLGRRGFFTYFEGRYNPARAVNFHSLAIADAFLTLKRLEAEGRFEVVVVQTEPECWVTVERHELKPDLFVELKRPSGAIERLWLEVDMATEGQRQIKDKLSRFWNAYNEADETDWPIWPRVLWVAIDDERAKELSWFISQGPADAQPLFKVTTLAKLSTEI